MIYDVIIIGAGQAGLATAYFLQQQGKNIVVLEQGPVLGSAWLGRYDSLTLFTPARYSCLPGLSFPLPDNLCPNRQQVASYFSRYAEVYGLPIKTEQRVISLVQVGDCFEVQAENATGLSLFTARRVVIATGASQHPFVPSYTTQPDVSVFQVHSSQYTNPRMLPVGDVLVVGAGNSGAQLSVELATTAASSQRRVYLSIRHPLVFKPLSILGKSIFWWGEKTGLFNLSIDAWPGRRFKGKPEGVYSDTLKQLISLGRVVVVPEIQSFAGRTIRLSDGRVIECQSILWATGYRSDYRWVKVPGALDKDGQPIHRNGVSVVKGIYFVGLAWQRTITSALIQGAGKDAAFIAEVIRKRSQAFPG